jgi:NitT/TauT family transport system permease protein
LPITLIVIVLLWQALLPESGGVALILPRPNRILEKFVSVTQNGLLIRELGVTALEIFLGFSFGVGIAFGIGYSIAHNRLLEQILAPYLVGFQALPIVAIAPALILWLGPGLASNSVICAFIVFFPMLMSTVVGIKTIDADRHELFNSWAVTRWNRFRHLEFPGALPSLFGGLKVSVILAVAGAVVAESVTPIGGIGSLLYAARSRYDSALAWVAVFTLTAFALTLYGAVNALERRLLRWRRS